MLLGEGGVCFGIGQRSLGQKRGERRTSVLRFSFFHLGSRPADLWKKLKAIVVQH